MIIAIAAVSCDMLRSMHLKLHLIQRYKLYGSVGHSGTDEESRTANTVLQFESNLTNWTQFVSVIPKNLPFALPGFSHPPHRLLSEPLHAPLSRVPPKSGGGWNRPRYQDSRMPNFKWMSTHVNTSTHPKGATWNPKPGWMGNDGNITLQDPFQQAIPAGHSGSVPSHPACKRDGMVTKALFLARSKQSGRNLGQAMSSKIKGFTTTSGSKYDVANATCRK